MRFASDGIIAYSTDIKFGTSGAPCLDRNLNVVATQQRSDAALESSAAELLAISISAIGRDLKTKGIRLGSETKPEPNRASSEADPGVHRGLGPSNVLWVDDTPDNNISERRSLDVLEVNFALARSTEEALQLVQKQTFDVIISDMARPGDRRAGLTLLNRLKSIGNQIPFIVYSAKGAIAFGSELQQQGVFGSTNNADELVSLVLTALKERPTPSVKSTRKTARRKVRTTRATKARKKRFKLK